MRKATEDLLTTAEAARMLGYTVQHTRLLIRTGKLKAVKFGRDWMVSRGAVEALRASDESAGQQ